LSSNKGNRNTRLRAIATQVAEAPWRTRSLTNTLDVAHTRSISKAANNQAVSWTIGSKPNANSKVERFRMRGPAS